MPQRALLAAICLVTFSIVLFGQADRATFTGTVSDPAGAVVPNASVTPPAIGGFARTNTYAVGQKTNGICSNGYGYINVIPGATG
jgi:hypothetical protein